MKCLLVSTLLDDLRCLGLLSIHSHLRNSGRHDVTLVFLPNTQGHEPNESDCLIQFARDNGVDVVGLSLMTMNYRKCVSLTKRMREELPEAVFVWGGIHPTIAPEECIEHADYVCIGEGEIPMLELLDRLEAGRSASDLGNFWVRDGNNVTRNKPRLFPNIDDYPDVAYDWDHFYLFEDGALKPFSQELYRKYSMWSGTNYSTITTRGCPHACAYCCNSALKGKMYGKKLRRRSVKRIISELKRAQEYLPFTKVINLQDDCFLATPQDWLAEFCSAYKREIGLPFFCRATPTSITEERVRLVTDAGLTGVSIGLQSGDDWINREVYNRRMTAEDFLRAAEIIKRHKLWAVYDIILQGPYDTDESNYKTAELLLRIGKPILINTFFMVLYPNTPLRQRCEEEGISVDGDPYALGYGNPHWGFFPHFFALIPIMPGRLMKYFLERRERRWVQASVRFLFHRLSAVHRLRAFLSRSGFSNRIVRLIFAIQSRW